eukprot:CAMPEP_0115334946 /NCGR_PEP_ID=MMETSP0270-20121206/88176_2 /TAXON_ID=71861 /ORGANISM="Scrippsiella trochoidea, Strain CCMP3099" /LENGTH=131 /DNA_ID=CAMNT_0002755951 /DNA_START=160 /DNA_END=551 /DNA_ORIENTATION=-
MTPSASSSGNESVTFCTRALTSRSLDQRLLAFPAPFALVAPEPPLCEDLADFFEPADPTEKFDKPRFSKDVGPSPGCLLPARPDFKDSTDLSSFVRSGSFQPAGSASVLATISSTDVLSALPTCGVSACWL